MFDVRVIVAESKAAYVVNLDAYMHLCKRYHSKAEFMNEEEKEALKEQVTRDLASILKYYVEDYKSNVGDEITQNVEQILVYIEELDTFKQLTNLVDVDLFDTVLMEVFKDD